MINIISLLGLIFTIFLILDEFKKPGYCPRFLKIPACYLVFLAFLLVLLSEKLLINNLFILGVCIGLGLAAWFSINQLLGRHQCPQLFKIPMCFVSFFVFLILIVLKLL